MAEGGGLAPQRQGPPIPLRTGAGALVRFTFRDWRAAGRVDRHAQILRTIRVQAGGGGRSASLPLDWRMAEHSKLTQLRRAVVLPTRARGLAG